MLLFDLFIGELLAKVGHHMPQLRSTDESVTIAIEHFESLDEFLARAFGIQVEDVWYETAVPHAARRSFSGRHIP